MGNVQLVVGWTMYSEEWTSSLLKIPTWIYESLWCGKTIFATLCGQTVSIVYKPNKPSEEMD